VYGDVTYEEADAQGAAAHDEQAHDDALTRVHVKPSMLRDLHLSTRPAEARTAGDVVVGAAAMSRGSAPYCSETFYALVARLCAC